MGFIQIWIELRQFRFSLRVEIVKFLFHFVCLCIRLRSVWGGLEICNVI